MLKQFHADYFQAIIQLRPADERMIDYVEKQVEKNDKVWISQKVFLKTGVDYYLSSNRFARQIGKKLKKAFNGELRESTKLFSRDRQSSKDLHRVTVCFRLREDNG